jgi:hypothetical protein
VRRALPAGDRLDHLKLGDRKPGEGRRHPTPWGWETQAFSNRVKKNREKAKAAKAARRKNR